MNSQASLSPDTSVIMSALLLTPMGLIKKAPVREDRDGPAARSEGFYCPTERRREENSNILFFSELRTVLGSCCCQGT